MNFKDLDQNRLKFVIRNATNKSLSEFFKRNQKRLIIEGIKIQIIPKDFIKGVDLFASFNQKALSIANSWFENNLDVSKDISLEGAINFFLSVENKDNEPDVELDILNSKVIFMELLKAEPKKSLVDFMKSTIIEKSDEILPVENLVNLNNFSISNILQYIESQSVELKSLSLDELFVLSIINRDSNQEIIEVAKNKAMVKNINFDEYESVISSVNLNKIEKENRRHSDKGVEVTQSLQLSNVRDIDVENILVIGTVTNIVESSGNRFIKVLGVIENRKLYELTHIQKQSIFPDSGDLIWYVKDFKRLLQKNEVGIFKVMPSSFGSSGNHISTKFTIYEFVSKLNHVRVCEENTLDRIALTKWFYRNEIDIAEKYSYVLSNDKLIKPYKVNNQKIDFDRPMDVIVNTEIYKIDKNLYSPEHSTAISIIDLSPSESYLKKLLKNVEFNQSSFTKNQISNLIEEIKETKEAHDSEKIPEVLEDLNELLRKQDLFESIVKKITDTPEVKSAINDIVISKSNEIIAKKYELTNEVRQLEQQKASFAKTLDLEKEQFKKLKLSFSNDIKDIFQKAIVNGKDMLAETAFFQALISKDNFRSDAIEVNHISSPNLHGISYKKTGTQPVADKIKSFPYKAVKTKKLIESLLDCSSIGLSIGIKGGASGIVARFIAERLTTETYYIDIEMRPGVTSVSELSLDEASSNYDFVYLIRNFDIAPISIYGHDIVDLCYLRAIDKDVTQYPKVIVTYEDSGLGLDIPIAFQKSLIIIDLDHIELEDKEVTLDDFESYLETLNLPQSQRYVIDKLVAKIKSSSNTFNSERLSSLIGLIDQFYIKNLILCSGERAT